jgi:hypothetical protein
MSRFKVLTFSVADPGSRILIFIHPGSRIQQQTKRGGKNLIVSPFLLSKKFTEVKNYLVFEQVQKKV